MENQNINNSAGTNPEIMPIDPTGDISYTPASSFVVHRTTHGRTLIISVAALTIATFLLMQFGGFDRIGKFLGANASTVHTITLAGKQNLAGDEYAEKPSWLVPGSPAETNGTAIFDSFSSVPDANFTDTPGMIVPLSNASATSDNTITEHTYSSPILNLGGDDITLKSVRIVHYPGSTSGTIFSYRTGNSLESLNAANFTPFELIPTPFNGSDKVMSSEMSLDIVTGRYLQYRVDFGVVEIRFVGRPAVYGFTATFTGGVGEDPAVQHAQSASVAEEMERTISIEYTGDNIPAKANLAVYAADNPIPVYTMNNINLSERLSFTFEATLPDGSYAALLRAPGYAPKIVVFELVNGATEIAVTAGAFETEALDLFQAADLNGDGVVNSIDVNILLSQFGTPPSTP